MISDDIVQTTGKLLRQIYKPKLANKYLDPLQRQGLRVPLDEMYTSLQYVDVSDVNTQSRQQMIQ